MQYKLSSRPEANTVTHLANGEDEANHTTPSTEPESYGTVVRILERAFGLDNNEICLSSGEDGEPRPECRKAQCRHFSIELFRQEVDIVSVDRCFLPMPRHNRLRRHLVREGTQ